MRWLGRLASQTNGLEQAAQQTRALQDQMFRAVADVAATTQQTWSWLTEVMQAVRVEGQHRHQTTVELLRAARQEGHQRLEVATLRHEELTRWYVEGMKTLQLLIQEQGQCHQDAAGWHTESLAQVQNFWGSMQKSWFEQGQQMNQFRHALAGLIDPPDVRSQRSEVRDQRSEVRGEVDDSSATVPASCRVCGGSLVFKWTKRVLNDRYEAPYHECSRCGTLQIINPYWLEEAYRDENRPLFWNPDQGRFVRNFSMYCYLSALHGAGLAGKEPRWLDYGGGYGLLTQMLKDAGHDAWLYDPYVSTPYFVPERRIANLDEVEAGTFDAVTAFEVFEHLDNPRQVGEQLRRLLRPEGLLILSTGLYDPSQHDADWAYLSCEAGQHITLWSRTGLRHLARQLGFQSLGYFPSDQGFMVILARLEQERLHEGLSRALALLRDPNFLDLMTYSWELGRKGLLTMLPAPRVQSVTAPEGGATCVS
jgi:SAM-dependent methyltransferase